MAPPSRRQSAARSNRENVIGRRLSEGSNDGSAGSSQFQSAVSHNSSSVRSQSSLFESARSGSSENPLVGSFVSAESEAAPQSGQRSERVSQEVNEVLVEEVASQQSSYPNSPERKKPRPSYPQSPQVPDRRASSLDSGDDAPGQSQPSQPPSYGPIFSTPATTQGRNNIPGGPVLTVQYIAACRKANEEMLTELTTIIECNECHERLEAKLQVREARIMTQDTSIHLDTKEHICRKCRGLYTKTRFASREDYSLFQNPKRDGCLTPLRLRNISDPNAHILRTLLDLKLTHFETSLISPLVAYMTIVHVGGRNTQYKGNMCVVVQDVQHMSNQLARCLPRPQAEVVIIRPRGEAVRHIKIRTFALLGFRV